MRIPRKPAPDRALLIAHRLGVKPEECMYVGDTDTDMKTGNRACMLTIGVLWGFRNAGNWKNYHAHYIIERPEGITGYTEEKGNIMQSYSERMSGSIFKKQSQLLMNR